MAEFTYNNAQNISTDHIHFELNYGYHLHVFYKKDINPCSKLKSVDKLLTELRELMAVCRKNLYYAQKLQKQDNNKTVKPKSYILGNKVWLNSKYIKTRWNCKLEAEFFGLFQVFHLVGNQAYKLELPKSWSIYNIFYVSLLEYDIIRKGQVDETTSQLDFEVNDKGKKYKVERI